MVSARTQYTSYWNAFLLLPAVKLGQGNIFRSVCQEFCPQVGGVSRPTPRGMLGGLAGGVSRPRPGGKVVYPIMH